MNWLKLVAYGVFVILAVSWWLGNRISDEKEDEARPLRQQDRAACNYLAEQGGVHSWDEWVTILSTGEQMASPIRTDAHSTDVRDAFARARVSFDLLATGASSEEILATSGLNDIREACADL